MYLINKNVVVINSNYCYGGKMKILYLAPISYNGLKQRPQHIADILSEKCKVWYIEPTISLLKYMIKGGETFKAKKRIINENLQIIKLNGAFTNHISCQAFYIFRFNVISERLQLKKYLKKADIIWIGYPGWYDLIKKVKNKMIIYDKMDDDVNITMNPLMRKLLLKVEPKLIDKANIIFVTAIKFYREIKLKNKNVHLLPNGVCDDIQYIFKKKLDSKEKIFGYVGTIAHWFDVKVIEIILKNNKNNKVILVGPNYISKIESSNVKYLGTINKELLPEIIDTFDICLYPFKKNDFLDTIDPVKIYEYLALNKPVLAVNSEEMEKFNGLIETYDNYEELEIKLNKVFKSPFKEEERKAFIQQNSWFSRVKYAINIINRMKV